MTPSSISTNTMGGYVRGKPPVRPNGRRTLLLVIGVCLLSLVVFSQLGENGILSWFELRGAVDQLQENVATLEADNTDLETDIQALQDDPSTLEKLAREGHNMRSPQEEVLLVLPAEKTGLAPHND